MNNIYKKYCNDLQNPALGAYAIAMFVKEYNIVSEQEKASLLHLFVVIPLLMNKSFRKLVVTDNYKCQKKVLGTLINKLCSDEDVAGTLHSNIRNYKEYTLTSFIFALRLGLITIENGKELNVSVEIHKNPNIIIHTASILGKLFARGNLLNFIIYTGVML